MARWRPRLWKLRVSCCDWPSGDHEAKPRPLVEGSDFAVFQRHGATAREAKLRDMMEELSASQARRDGSDPLEEVSLIMLNYLL